MNTDTRLLKVLLAIATGSFFVLVAGSATAVFLHQQQSVVLSGVVIAVASIGYFSLLALWIYWIVLLWRNGRTTELLLCFVLPYIYAVYMTMKVLRSSQAPSIRGASGGA